MIINFAKYIFFSISETYVVWKLKQVKFYFYYLSDSLSQIYLFPFFRNTLVYGNFMSLVLYNTIPGHVRTHLNLCI